MLFSNPYSQKQVRTLRWGVSARVDSIDLSQLRRSILINREEVIIFRFEMSKSCFGQAPHEQPSPPRDRVVKRILRRRHSSGLAGYAKHQMGQRLRTQCIPLCSWNDLGGRSARPAQICDVRIGSKLIPKVPCAVSASYNYHSSRVN